MIFLTAKQIDALAEMKMGDTVLVTYADAKIANGIDPINTEGGDAIHATVTGYSVRVSVDGICSKVRD